MSKKARRVTLKLFLVSIVALFWEVMLIRWFSNEMPLLSYFRSLVILGSFLGLGMGCIARRVKANEAALVIAFLAAAAGLSMAVFLWGDDLRARGISHGLGVQQQDEIQDFSPDITMEFEGREEGGQYVVGGGFIWVVGLFFPLGILLGRCFDAAQPLRAYLINIAGSLVGTLLFTVLSFTSSGPDMWWAIGCLMALALLVAVAAKRMGLVVGVVLCIAAFTFVGKVTWRENVIWSPYQRISWRDMYLSSKGKQELLRSFVLVNYQYHQQIVNFSILPKGESDDRIMARLRELDGKLTGAGSLAFFYLGYEIPYREVKPKDVLIIGDGVGNEAAAALRNGVERIDSVEIEPGIIELSRRHHPERPYWSDRVTVICDDARAFLQRSKKQYDMIVMNAVDSHSQFATSANLRLDSYIFTQEFFEQVHSHLRDGGTFAFEFSGFHWHIPWCRLRLKEMVWRALGYKLTDKNAYLGGGGPLFLIPKLDPPDRSQWGPIPVATDDWPEFYLRSRAVPRAYVVLIIVVLLAAVVGTAALRPVGMSRFRPHFFLLGAAFMLLEIKSITELSLMFGNTWLVSSCVISAILVAIAMANLLVLRFGRVPYLLSYTLLLGSLAAGYFLPTSLFLEWSFALRGLASSARVAVPIFAAGLVFGSSFKEAEQPGAALGWNLLGAMVGGLGEYMCLIVGVSAMGLIAMMCYIVSMLPLMSRRTPRTTG